MVSVWLVKPITRLHRSRDKDKVLAIVRGLRGVLRKGSSLICMIHVLEGNLHEPGWDAYSESKALEIAQVLEDNGIEWELQKL